MKTVSTLIRIMPVILVIPATLLAQQGSGRITGTITDSTGAAVPAVIVSVTSPETGIRRTAETNADGTYVVSQLPVGDYALQATKEGFKTLSRSGIRIDVNASPTLDLRLELGTVSERIDVDAQAVTINTENQAIGNSRYEVQLKNLPIVVREVQALVGQTAGVPFGTTDTVGGNVQQGSRSGMQVLSDGAQLNPFQTTAWPAIDGIGRRADLTVPSVDAIAEVKWVTNGGSAEYAQPTQVIVASKAGSNALHAAAWEDYRSGGLGSRRWEAPQRESFVRHQYGGTVSGPVIKDKMFFFGGVDVFSHTLGSLLNARQPTAAERSGDLSALLRRTDTRRTARARHHLRPAHQPALPGQCHSDESHKPGRVRTVEADPARARSVRQRERIQCGHVQAAIRQVGEIRRALGLQRHIQRPPLRPQHVRVSRSGFSIRGKRSGRLWLLHQEAMDPCRIGQLDPHLNPTTVTVLQFTMRSMPFKNTPSGGNTTFGVPISNLSPEPPFGGRSGHPYQFQRPRHQRSV